MEPPEGQVKRAMDPRRVRAWNFDEMRAAGALGQERSTSPSEGTPTFGLAVSGFTPLNQGTFPQSKVEIAPQKPSSVGQERRKPRRINDAKGASTGQTQTRKRKQNAMCSITSKSETSSKRPRSREPKVLGADYPQQQDISNSFATSKVGPHGKFADKASTAEELKLPAGVVSKPNTTGTDSRSGSTPVRLGQAYQRTCGEKASCPAAEPKSSPGLDGSHSHVESLALDINLPDGEGSFDDLSDEAMEAAAFEEMETDPPQDHQSLSYATVIGRGSDQSFEYVRGTSPTKSPAAADYLPDDRCFSPDPRSLNPALGESNDESPEIVDLLTDDEFDEVMQCARRQMEKKQRAQAKTVNTEPYDDEDLETELLNFDIPTSQRNPGQSPPFTQRTPLGSPAKKLQWMPPKLYTAHKRQQVLRSPLTDTSSISPMSPLAEKSPNITSQVVFSKDEYNAPFVRPPFPNRLLSRSPIPGLSPTTVLRTCFRIGEALNAASIALRNSVDAVVELYCCVRSSSREDNSYKQSFVFCDLFNSDKPPFLDGQYAIWKGVSLWEHDSKQFLGESGKGKMARVVGRIKRGNANVGWDMTILSIWKADRDDVAIVKGIVCS